MTRNTLLTGLLFIIGISVKSRSARKNYGDRASEAPFQATWTKRNSLKIWEERLMTKYAAFMTLTYSTHAFQRAFLFLAVMTLGLAFGAEQAVLAQQAARIRVEVGKIKFNSLKHPVDPTELHITIQRPVIAKASYDPRTKRFNFEGLSEGQTRVTIVGTYPNPNAGGGGGIAGRLQQNAVPYRHLVDVTVVPLAPDPNANAFRAEVAPGKVKDIPIDALLGPEFLRPSDEGRRWRNLRFTFGDNRIALAELAGKTKIRVTGVKPGKTMLRLEGQRFRNNVWETIERAIEATVSGGPNAGVPADPWLEGLERRLEEMKRTAAQAGTDELKIDGSIRNFEGLGTVVSNTIATERGSQKPRRPRLERLEDLRGEAQDNLVRLREQHAEIAKQIRTIGWHQMLSHLNIVLGKKPARRTFFCPPNPGKSYGTIYGTGSYLINSSLCGAAVHDGATTFRGGNITVEFRQGRSGDRYVGSTRNEVVTDSWDRDWGSFGFVK